MKISVIMPVYNSSQYLSESIESVLNQTFKDFEFIIINDGSTDNSEEIINQYHDSRIKFFNFKTNSGYTNRLNFGLQEAQGEFIARLDSDDIALPNRFERQLLVLEKNENLLVCGSNIQLFGKGWLNFNWVITGVPDLVKVSLLINNSVCHPSVMIRSSAIKKNDIYYKSSYEPCEDYKMWVDLSSKGGIINVEEVLLKYRIHENQVSKTRSLEQGVLRNIILKEQLELLKIFPTQKEVELHHTLEIPLQIILSPDYLPNLKKWLKKLKVANKVPKIYNQYILETYLDQLYHQKVASFRIRYSTLSFFQKIKFQIKGLFI